MVVNNGASGVRLALLHKTLYHKFMYFLFSLIQFFIKIGYRVTLLTSYSTMPIPDASHSTLNTFVKSGSHMIEASIIFFFHLPKRFSCSICPLEFTLLHAVRDGRQWC